MNRIFLVYPGHSFSTIDVARGWQGALRRAGFEVPHLNHHHNIAFYRFACLTWEKNNPDFKHKFEDILWLTANDVIAKAVELMPLDLVIIVTGLLIHPKAYEGLRKIGLPIALILTESPYSDYTQGELAKMVDITFTNDKASVEYLSQFCPTYYLPHSWDPERHYPREVGEEYHHDVFFLGTLYDVREKLFKGVDWTGIDAHIEGTKLKELPDRMQIEGAMKNDEVLKHYAGSKIVLNPHKDKALTVQPYSLGPRTFEAAACGAFQIISNNRAETKEVFGDILPVFDGPAELQELIHYFLEHDDERKERARLARACIAEFTFDHRLERIFLPTIKEVLK